MVAYARNDKILLRSTDNDQTITDPERVKQEMTDHVETGLQTLQRRGVLASADDGAA